MSYRENLLCNIGSTTRLFIAKTLLLINYSDFRLMKITLKQLQYLCITNAKSPSITLSEATRQQ